MLVASLGAAAVIMITVGGCLRMIYLWSNRHQIRQDLIQSRLDEIRHEVDMRGLEETLRVRYGGIHN